MWTTHGNFEARPKFSQIAPEDPVKTWLSTWGPDPRSRRRLGATVSPQVCFWTLLFQGGAASIRRVFLYLAWDVCCFRPTGDGSQVNLNIGIPGIDAEDKGPCRMLTVGGNHAVFRAGQVLPILPMFLSMISSLRSSCRRSGAKVYERRCFHSRKYGNTSRFAVVRAGGF